MATNDSMNDTNFDYFYNENINEIIKNQGSSEGNVLDDANNMKRAAAQLYNTKTRYESSVPKRTWTTWEGRETSYDSKETVRNIGGLLSEKMAYAISKRNEPSVAGNAAVIGYPSNQPFTIEGRKFTVNDYYTDSAYADLGMKSYDEENPVDNSALFANDSGNPNSYYGRYGDPETMSEKSYTLDKYNGLAMGESNILNPDFQFNELDDVRSDFRMPYLGRLYSERIYSFNLPKVIFQLGTVSINIGALSGLTAIMFGNKSGHTLGQYLRDPGTNIFKLGLQKLSAVIGSVASGVSSIILKKKRMYKFTPNSTVFLTYVNEMLAEVAAWMGLGKFDFDPSVGDKLQSLMNEKSESVSSSQYDDNAGNYTPGEKAFFGINDKGDSVNQPSDYKSNSSVTIDNTTDGSGFQRFPYLGKKESLDVRSILPTMNGKNTGPSVRNDGRASALRFYNTDCYIPFGLSKAVNVSETFANDTQENPITAQINSTGQNNQQQFMIGQVPSDVLGGFDQIVEGAKNGGLGGALTAAGSQLAGKHVAKLKSFMTGQMSGELGMVQSGNSRLILPEIWADSSFDRQYSLSFKLFSPYGNRLSIFENTIVPMLFLIAMSAPRQVGESSYTTPFYIKAFSKGLFSTSLGMVSNLSINKSEGRNDMTQDGFHRTLNISMTIKDLLPRLTMSMDAGMWGILSNKNDGFREYLAMIAGVDLDKREGIKNNMKVYMNSLASKFNVNKINLGVSHFLSNSIPAKLITNPRSLFYSSKTGESLRSQLGSPSSY